LYIKIIALLLFGISFETHIYTLCGQNLEILMLDAHKVSNGLEKVNIHGVIE